MRDLISERASRFDFRQTIPALPAIWAGIVTLLIAGPWLGGGYIFGTDWPGPRRFDFPLDLSSSAPLLAVLAAISQVASAELTGKIFVLGILFMAALIAYWAAPVEGFVPRAVASTVYVFNPFVFGRLHYGQMFLLAGYALLPWVALRIRQLLLEPSLIASLIAAISVALLGVVSTHLVLVAAVLAGALLLTHAVSAEEKLDYLKRVFPHVLLAAGAAIVASAYWVVPFAIGRGSVATTIAGVSGADVAAFASVPDEHLGLLPNLLGLYGFWAEDTGLFTSMKSFVPLWPAVLVVLMSIATAGAVVAFRSRRDRLSPWIAGLLISALIALVLEMGISHPLTSGLVTWLDAHVPVYRGMRDAGKWAAMLALLYSQLVGLGAAAICGWLRSRVHDLAKAESVGAIAGALLLALPLYYGNGLLYGMHGEVRPSHYPRGWYAADRVLAADAHSGRALFLPWHQYMAFSFVQNQNNIVACPAPTFFSISILASADPEIPGVTPPNNPDQTAVASLVGSGSSGQWAEVLAAHGIKYILLARELDWDSFAYLDYQAGLVRVGDYGSIVLYRNSLVP